jgi:hypothetical protein
MVVIPDSLRRDFADNSVTYAKLKFAHEVLISARPSLSSIKAPALLGLFCCGSAKCAGNKQPRSIGAAEFGLKWFALADKPLQYARPLI